MAIIAGGGGFFKIEAYSPGGGCSQALGTTDPLGSGNLDPILGYINGKITFCQTNSVILPNRFKIHTFYVIIGVFLDRKHGKIIVSYFLLPRCAQYIPASNSWANLTAMTKIHKPLSQGIKQLFPLCT